NRKVVTALALSSWIDPPGHGSAFGTSSRTTWSRSRPDTGDSTVRVIGVVQGKVSPTRSPSLSTSRHPVNVTFMVLLICWAAGGAADAVPTTAPRPAPTSARLVAAAATPIDRAVH